VSLPRTFRAALEDGRLHNTFHDSSPNGGSIFGFEGLSKTVDLDSQFKPEVESTGRLKKCLDVLLWGNDYARKNLTGIFKA
jgi:hypothetical protein